MKYTFSLTAGERRFEMTSKSSMRSGRRFMDYAVGGRPLHGLLLSSERGSLADDLIPVLVYDWPPEDDIDSLLGERRSDLDDGRVPLYVCPECGDLGCGAITAVVERSSETVGWRELGYQTNYEPFDDDQRLTDVGPFEFDRSEYEAALVEFRAGWAVGAAQRAAEAELERPPWKRSRLKLFGRRQR